MPEKTEWFPHEIKPVHRGWYEIKQFNGTSMRWWDGKWRFERGGYVVYMRIRAWRGLVAPV